MESTTITHQPEDKDEDKDYTMHPFVKWVGGKSKYIQHILPYLPNTFDRYYEPFIGGGALFFHLQPNKAYISDVNIELINCYQTIRSDVYGLMKELDKYKETNREEQYYVFRSEYNKLKKEHQYSYDDVVSQEGASEGASEGTGEEGKGICVRKAGLFIFLNKTSFRGIYRENKSGEMNVPYGNYKSPTLYESSNLLNIHKYLSSNDIMIQVHSYDKIRPTTNDFVYFDPPYDQEKSSDFVSYTKDKFRQEDLYKFITELNCGFVLSNSPTTYIKNLYKDYGQKELSGKRNVDVKKVKTVKNIEIIIYKEDS